MGIILWELVFRCINGHYEQPYAEFPFIHFDFQIIIQAAKKGSRPSIPASCPTAVSELINRLWASSPATRPACDRLIENVLHLQEMYRQNKADWHAAILRTASKQSLLLNLENGDIKRSEDLDQSSPNSCVPSDRALTSSVNSKDSYRDPADMQSRDDESTEDSSKSNLQTPGEQQKLSQNEEESSKFRNSLDSKDFDNLTNENKSKLRNSTSIIEDSIPQIKPKKIRKRGGS